FDNINHAVLVEIINQKIKDARFLKLIRSFLKAGYMEDWKYHKTYSGCPQGGIISPILANIYLNELDRHVMKIKKEFDVATKARYTPEYTKLVGLRQRLHNKIKNSNGIEREKLIEEYKSATAQMLKLPAKQCDDKKIKYVRYADDFLIAVNGNRQDCEKIKQELTEFISTTLKMELSQEKTLITHSNTPARFL
ncbi:TPA: group II intron reverse transcriptase domain-containing protein, partial [Clostridioides difficile]|nr:group II intron reverse transcriptase domain-containing protein [Clostridioides difficile]